MCALIPAHNDDYTLAHCLRSIADAFDRVVVLDDASTDLTREVCAEYPSVTYVRHNSGQQLGWVTSRNILTKHTTARWLFFLDADDVLCEYNADLLTAITSYREPVVRLGLHELWGDLNHGTQRRQHYDRCHIMVDRARFADVKWAGVRTAKCKGTSAIARHSPGPLFFHIKGCKSDARLVERQLVRNWLQGQRQGPPPPKQVARMDPTEVHERAMKMILRSKCDKLQRRYPGGVRRPRTLVDEVRAGQRFEIVYNGDGLPCDRIDRGWTL
jgi:glycosyltransferase involved in cell wall biosynthesis